MSKKLKYEKINGSNNVTSIDLENGYSIIAMSGENKDIDSYIVSLYLKENSIDTLRLIGAADKLVFTKSQLNYGINFSILKMVSEYLENGFFQYYIDQYEFEEKLISEGIERLERGTK